MGLFERMSRAREEKRQQKKKRGLSDGTSGPLRVSVLLEYPPPGPGPEEVGLRDGHARMSANLRLAATGSTARTLWADALCINQDDPSEKSVQIQLMGEIYRKARRVITYIGDGDSYTQSAIAMAKKMMEWAQPRAPTFSPADTNQSYLNLCSHLGIESIESVIECHPNPSVRSIQGMLDASWSMRVWILQESLLNDNVIMMCGRHEMPWTMLDELGALITQEKLPYVLKYNNIANTDKDAGSARTIRRMASLRGVFKSMALLDIINSTHHMLCFDPRDKIYGLYGVLNARNEAQHCAKIEMEVSYQKSVADVYTETAIFLLSQPSGLGLFTSIGVEPNIQGLPSWVPDWSETLSKVFFLSRQQAYFASGRTQLVLSIDKQLKRITLSGARIDRVTHVTGEIVGTILNPDPGLDNFTLPFGFFIEFLGRENDVDSLVWKVKIDKAGPFALKVFYFRHWNFLRRNQGGDLTRPLASPQLYVDYFDPFNCECRAYGRFKEEKREDLAVRALGYLLLSPQQEIDLAVRVMGRSTPPPSANAATLDGDNFWGRHEQHRGLPVRAIVKHLVAGNLKAREPAQAADMWADLQALHSLGIFVNDTHGGNYLNGKLVDLSRSWTMYHPALDQIGARTLRSLMLDELQKLLDYYYDGADASTVIPQDLEAFCSGHLDRYTNFPKAFDWLKWEKNTDAAKAYVEGLFERGTH
ncbi:hypothetical protein NEMBOFW57_008198 [Staphylotrichum longicolle]|uniref:Heterokaryon incompatibility domain-containing protein n=1 Tax=Staphylotrichum longicolle TaxID=669026 RepID=A0AAD4HVM7_9PEZI|nr:hypothetical protein NEMBOFW57_008198 [Staphylotrichum longicolle]